MVDVDPTRDSPSEEASPAPAGRTKEPTNGAGNGDAQNAQFHALRQLLLGEAAANLDYVDGMRDPEQFAQHVAQVLPQAASIRSSQDGRLAESFAPTVEDALEASIRRNPKPLTDAIFPILGPAIRKAITHAMQSLVQNVNQAIESTLTPRGIRLRLKAKRTGRSYAELVVAESLVYRVEEVFLIHGETGLLLAHAAVPEATTPDTDLVSGMFTAIQDFVQDSFGVDDDAGLEQFRVGELTVLVEQGPLAVLAAVVRGTPTGAVRTALQETIESIHAERRSALETFDGDNAPFETVQPLLEGCLAKEHRPAPEPTPARKVLRRAIPAVFVLGLLTLLGLWIASAIRQNALEGRFDAWVEALREHPGAQVLATIRDDDRLHVVYAQDPLAPDVDSIRAQHMRPDDEATHAAFVAELPHGPYILTRARNRLGAPKGVSFTLGADQRVIASGLAPGAWIARSRDIGPLVLKTGYDDRNVWPSRLAAIRGPKDQIEKHVLAFERGEDLFGLSAEKRLAPLDDALRALDTGVLELASQEAASLDVKVRPVIVPGTPQDSDEDQRTTRLVNRVVRALKAKGLQRLRFLPGAFMDAARIPGAGVNEDAAKKIRHVVLDVRVPDSLLKDES